MADDRGFFNNRKRKVGFLERIFSKRYKEAGSTSSSTSVQGDPFSCVLNFDGCSKGNPGKAGAGAVLSPENGSWVLRLREGVGNATNSVAEYQALILGLKYALDNRFTHIRVRGDSMLVCKQVKGEWKVKNPNLARLCGEARELKDQFQFFEIDYVLRESNTTADAEANLGCFLPDGEVETRQVTIDHGSKYPTAVVGASMADDRGFFNNRKRKVGFLGRNSSKRCKVGSTSSSTSVQGDLFSCILNFDGCSKGNPGKAGAGAVLHSQNGSWVLRLREGVGNATSNVAEYRALILGLKYALDNGFTHIRVRGDSMLVCMQVKGEWKVENPNMARLCGEARELKDQFQFFEIGHVPGELNTIADAEANLGCSLHDGEVEIEWGYPTD